MKNVLLLLVVAACAAAISCSPDPPLPNLAVTATTVPSAAVSATASWPLGVTVSVTGTAVDTIELQYWYSSDAVLGTGDTLVGESHLRGEVAPGDYTATLTADFSVAKAGGGPGAHWIVILVDPEEFVAESDEADNTFLAPVTVLYDRLIVDTYRPTGGAGTVSTHLTLYDSAGAVVQSNEGGSPDGTCACIDCTAGVLPGTYYVQVRAADADPAQAGPYAIRALFAPDDDYTEWRFGSYSNPDPYEADDGAASGVPTQPVPLVPGLDGKLNRYLASGDVDWMVLTLP